jgi:2-dehydro-3-deoxyglucarate aldolase
MASAGFDWLVIDMEHSAVNDLAQTQNLIQVIDLCGCIPIVRVPENEPTVIKQVMDAGAHGIIVPMVNSPQAAQSAVQSIYYPPKGIRGVGIWRAQDYGKSFNDYSSWLNENGFVIVQIEHITAVDNLPGILEIEGLHGFFVGLYDLSASLGFPGDFDHPLVRAAIQRIESLAAATDKWVGKHILYPNRQSLITAISSGYNFIAYGSDFTFLSERVDLEIKFIKQELAASDRDQ